MKKTQMKTGTAVLVTKDDGSILETKTSSEPWKLGGHTWVVLVDGITGCYSLKRVKQK